MTAYRIISGGETMRLRWLGSSAKLAFAPVGVDFPFITYSREIAEKVAEEYGGKVQEIKEG